MVIMPAAEGDRSITVLRVPDCSTIRTVLPLRAGWRSNSISTSRWLIKTHATDIMASNMLSGGVRKGDDYKNVCSNNQAVIDRQIRHAVY